MKDVEKQATDSAEECHALIAVVALRLFEL